MFFSLQARFTGVKAEDPARDGDALGDPLKSESPGSEDPVPEAWIRKIMENRELLESWELLDKMELFHEPDLYVYHNLYN